MALEVILFVCAAIGVCIGCLVPNRWLPPLPNDKFLHFAAFAVLTALALRIAGDAREAVWWLGALVLGGWVIECLQSLLPDRRFCWRDMAANVAGILCAAIIMVFLDQFGRSIAPPIQSAKWNVPSMPIAYSGAGLLRYRTTQ